MRMFAAVPLVLCAMIASAPAAEELTSRDFAYGYMLKVRQQGAVYSLPLPNEVYRKVRRADLGDIRIFNSAGETVPHVIRQLESADEKARLTVEVPFFPLLENGSGGTDNISLSVRRDADGTIIDIDSSRVGSEDNTQPTGYLLDLGEQRTEIENLEIFWHADTEHASSSVMVHQSSDLQRWQPLVYKTTLVDLEYEGNRVEQRKIRLPRRPERYLKISWLPPSPALRFSRVTAVSRPLVSRQNMQWVSLYNGESVQVNGYTGIDFSSNYRLPVRSVRLQFPEENSIISASVQSRVDTDDTWRERCSGVFYLLSMNGQRLQSEPCSFGTTTDRLWRLVVLDDGAGLAGGNRKVMLDLGWQSDELLFLARGTAPYLLAYGSGKLENRELSQRSDMILTALQQQQGGAIVQLATLGKHLELGGESILRPPPPPKPWKTWLLWGVLVAGVAVMGLMAFSLFRELRNTEHDTAEER